MKRGIFSILTVVVVIICLGVLPSTAQTQTKKRTMSSKSTMPNTAGRMTMSPLDMINNRTTNAQRKAAAASGIKRRAAEAARRPKQQSKTMMQNAPVGVPGGAALTLDELYFSGTYPNYANSPLPNPVDTVNCVAPNFCGIRKFVDTLPLPNVPNDLGQQLPVAVPDTTTFPGSDYYEISLVDYTEQMHKDLPPTKLRGYVQTNGGPGIPQYLGPLIIAQANRPVRIKFTNALATFANGGNLFIPVDKTVMGAGMGMSRGASDYLENRATIHLHGGATPWISDGTPHQWTVPAADFGATLYPRGDSVQFVPDMFFVNGVVVPQCSATLTSNCSPANLLSTPSTLPAGATNDPGPGSLTFYYTNQQSGRLMFYHDHAYGTTRLNVYAGEAAGYLLVDSVEADLTNGTNNTGVFTQAGITPAPVLPAEQIPLVIQDKTFVPQNPASAPVYSVGLAAAGSGYSAPVVSFSGGGCSTLPTATATFGDIVDPFGQFEFGAITGITLTTNGVGCTSDPVVTIADPTGSGAAAFASLATLSQEDPTWDTSIWGGTGQLWFPHVYMPNQWPTNPDGSGVNAMGRWDYASWFWPPFTANNYVVRGELPCGTLPGETCPGFPTTLTPAPDVTAAGFKHLGMGSIASLTPEAFMDTPLVNGTAYPSLTVEPKPYRLRILSAGNDRTLNLSMFIACGTGGYTPSPTAMPCPAPMAGIAPGTEVGMVPAVATAGFPAWWTSDGRAGGVPDPASMGPNWIVIGTEGGVLPKPVVVPPSPIDYEYGRRSVTVLNVSTHSLMLMPAERADVIVDFTAFAGKTLILYNDAPAPVPAFDTRYDYFTGDPDQTAEGGAPSTLAGFGPNTRTIMQIYVGTAVTQAEPAVNMSNLIKILPAAFKIAQPTPVVPESVYNSVYGGNFPNTYAHLADNYLTFMPIGAPAGSLPVTIPLLNKTIQELFELDYGRMNATLGTELPFTSFNQQTTIPLGYVDPTTEIIEDSVNVVSKPVGVLGDGSQIWKITHNGVDSHAIHFHLFNVQVINRFGWDGTTRPPDPTELGWKDTVRMNPLEIDFVALRPISQTLPWPIPDSIRLLDVTMPVGTTTASGGSFSDLNPFTGQGSPTTNALTNFGWEYVWHCHILGHEENDMMRPIQFQVPPAAPANLALAFNPWAAGSPASLSWTDMSFSASQSGGGFHVQIGTDPTFASTPIVTVASGGFGAVTSYPFNGTAGTTYYYQVQAFTPNGVSAWVGSSGVIQPATTTMAMVTNSPITYGTAGVVAVTVTSAQGTPTGNVALTVNGVPASPATAPLVLVGNTPTATFNLPGLAVGTYNLVATYPDVASVMITTNQAIGLLQVTTAPLTITGPSTTLAFGSPVPPLTPTVVGLVNGDTAAGLGITCSTTYTQGSGVPGPYPTTCTGPTTTNYAPVTNTNGAITVTQATTTTTITAQNPNPSNLNQAVTFNFSVAPQIFGVPTGNVTVNAATGESCGPTALVSGTGSCSITFTTSGVRQVTATYAGDTNFLGSVSLGVGQSVNVPAGLTVAPGLLAFGNVPVNTNSAPQTVTLTNSGASAVTITSYVFTAGFSRNGGTCGGTLAANRSCTVNVRFRPTSGIAYAGTLTINTNSPLTPSLTVNLSGTGAAPVAVLSSLTPFPLVAARGANAVGTLTLSNTGTAPLTITSITVGPPGSNPGQFTQTNNCGASVAAGSFCTITITFAPPARTRVGTKTGTLRVRDNSNGLASRQTTPLQGTAQ